MKTKQLLFTLSLIMLVTFVKAQVQYEYMSIEFNRFEKKAIRISIDGKMYLEEKADYQGTQEDNHNQNPLFSKVHEYEKQNWELMYFNTGFTTGFYPVAIAYLKKKKTEGK